ncbi:MAG: CBS domain-containing protein [Mariprofundaceae bacterium]
MLAKQVMVKEVVTAFIDELLGDVLVRMRQEGLRMLPVLDRANKIVGVFSTFSALEHVVPDYIVSGDLKQISYAPDMGILRRHFDEISQQSMLDVMNKKPLIVNQNESLLSVSAALTDFGQHEYAIVADDELQLQGIISAGDILDCLQAEPTGSYDA